MLCAALSSDSSSFSLCLAFCSGTKDVRSRRLRQLTRLFSLRSRLMIVRTTPRNILAKLWLNCDVSNFANFSSSSSQTFSGGKADQLGVTAVGTYFSRKSERYLYQENEQRSTRKDSVGGGTTTISTWTYQLNWISSPASQFRNPDQSDWPLGQPSDAASAFPVGSANCDQNNLDLKAGTWDLNPLVTTELISASSARDCVVNRPLPISSSLTNGISLQTVSQDTSYYYYPKGSTNQVGTYRISYTCKIVDELSLVGKAVRGPQGESTFEKFVASNGYTVFKVVGGFSSKDQIFQDLKDENVAITWALRFVGFLIIWLALQMFTAPCAMAPDIIPCIGPYISGLVGCMLCCATLMLAFFWSFLAISIGWCFYRPMIGIPLLCVALLALAGLIFWRCNKAKAFKEAQGKTGVSLTLAPAAAPAAAAPVGNAYPSPAGGYPSPADSSPYPAPGGSAYPSPAGESAYPAPGGYPAPV